MKVTAKLNNLRISSRKTNLVAGLIKGMDVFEAVNQLNTTIKGGCEPMRKLLQSAIANAENNFGLAKDNLYISEVLIGAGPTLKRWMPKAFGRAGRILKRTSKITIILEEKVEGKGRKSKTELEKIREERIKEKAKEEKSEKEEADNKAAKKEKISEKEEKVEKTSSKSAKSWTNKIFRRKSM